MQETDVESSIQTLKECILLLPRPFRNSQKFQNDEMRQLLRSASYHITLEFELKPNHPNYLFSLHPLQEIKSEIKSNPQSIIVIGEHLTPKQHINLEELFEIPIIDKFELVLDCFLRLQPLEILRIIDVLADILKS